MLLYLEVVGFFVVMGMGVGGFFVRRAEKTNDVRCLDIADVIHRALQKMRNPTKMKPSGTFYIIYIYFLTLLDPSYPMRSD